jgi:fused signal recognition particle receptor
VAVTGEIGGGPKLGLWSRVKRLALTDVGVLVRGAGRAELEEFERVLIEADLGVPAALELVGEIEERVRRGTLRTADDVRAALEDRLTRMLSEGSPAEPGRLARGEPGPTVMLLVGVNGVGKTTAAAKLARRLAREGRSVLLAASDTYRAGATEQLERWAERLGVPCVKGSAGGDPAAVAFDAVEAARTRSLDTVLVDTAGRLHTQDDLMKELQKVARVVGKKSPGAPHETLLVLDGSSGQNVVQQGKIFAAALPLTGVVVTKLDGTARGGSVVALRREVGLPLRFLGVGEMADDLEVFDPRAYARRLLAD